MEQSYANLRKYEQKIVDNYLDRFDLNPNEFLYRKQIRNGIYDGEIKHLIEEDEKGLFFEEDEKRVELKIEERVQTIYFLDVNDEIFCDCCIEALIETNHFPEMFENLVKEVDFITYEVVENE